MSGVKNRYLTIWYWSTFSNIRLLFFPSFFYFSALLSLSYFLTPGPPIITADATQHAVKHSKGKLECRVGSSPPPDKIVSELLICVVRPSLMFESTHTMCFYVFLLATPT